MTQNKFGYAEVVDTLSDLINAIVAFLAAIKGKFNLVNFLQFAIAEYSTIQEAVEDFGTFVQELKDLTAQEALNAVAEIEAKTDDHPVANTIVNVLKTGAITYDYIDKTLRGGRGVYDTIRNLFPGKAA